MKILITGVAGTGKSTISKALNEKGISSIDFSDVPGLCYWQHKITKQLENPLVKNVEWLDAHERICDIKKLKEILNQRGDVIITGVANINIANSNQGEYFDLFDKVLLLQCSPETIVKRMVLRKTRWGRNKTERIIR